MGLILYFSCLLEKKSVLNYDLGGGRCLESPSRKVILNSEKRRRKKKSMMFYFNNPSQACEPSSEKKSFRKKARTIQPLKPNLQTSENMPSY